MGVWLAAPGGEKRFSQLLPQETTAQACGRPSGTQSCPILCDPMDHTHTARQTSLSFTISRSLFRLMSIESVMPSNHVILCHPLLLLPSVFPSIRVFSSDPWISCFTKRRRQIWSLMRNLIQWAILHRVSDLTLLIC